MPNYYELLSVPPDASVVEIETACRKLYEYYRRQAAGPDLEKQRKSKRSLFLLKEIHTTLTDPEKRAAYDTSIGVRSAILTDITDQVVTDSLVSESAQNRLRWRSVLLVGLVLIVVIVIYSIGKPTQPPVFPTEPVLTLRGHKGGVWMAAWSPDGSRLASAGFDEAVRIWDADSGEQLTVLEGHNGVVSSVAWSPDGMYVITGNYEVILDHQSAVRLWDVNNRKQLAMISYEFGSVWSVAWSPKGMYTANSIGHMVMIWDVVNGGETFWEGHEEDVLAVAWSPDGSRLASACLDGTIKIRDVSTGATLTVLEGHEGGVWSVVYSSDGRFLASGGGDQTVRVWDAVSGEQQEVLRGHVDVVYSVTWSPDGRYLASGGMDQTVRLWDVSSGSQLNVLLSHKGSVLSVAWSPDGSHLASTSDYRDPIIRIWDMP